MSLVFDVMGQSVEVEPEATVIAGFTGRDRASVESHLLELRELGVPTPASVPCFYLAPGSWVVQGPSLTAVHDNTSGEAEMVLIFDRGVTYVTLGSDHTDRQGEAIDIPLSKLACEKIVASTAWRLDDVADRLDGVEITSWIVEDGRETIYQQGRLGELMSVADLLDATPFTTRPSCFVLFTGTLPAIGGIRPSASFRAELRDPGDGRSIELTYRINTLDVLKS